MATPPNHPAPFAYEDTDESSIQSVIAQNNKHDPTGALNALRIPPRRLKQSLTHPLWYTPSQHATAPYLSVTLTPSPPPSSTSTTLTPPYTLPLSISLTHHPFPTSNPSSRPITLSLPSLRLTPRHGLAYPYLLLHHTTSALSGSLKEIPLSSPNDDDDDEEGPGPAHPSEAVPDYQEPTPLQAPLVNAENGFISLAVGETRVLEEVTFAPGEGVLEVGGRYDLCFRGVRVEWWEWGTVAELEENGVRAEGRNGAGKAVIACSNLVGFIAGG